MILEELKMEADNPEYLIHEIFSSNFWKGHALGRSILGTKQTIRTFDREAVEKYYHQFYTPANILITAAGNLNHKRHAAAGGGAFCGPEAAANASAPRKRPSPTRR